MKQVVDLHLMIFARSVC